MLSLNVNISILLSFVYRYHVQFLHFQFIERNSAGNAPIFGRDHLLFSFIKLILNFTRFDNVCVSVEVPTNLLDRIPTNKEHCNNIIER